MRVLLSALALLLAACSSSPVKEPADSELSPREEGSGGTEPNSGAPSSAVTAPAYHKEDYPAGPYGVGVGATLENLAFLGWRDPVASAYDPSKLETVRLSDFYNPDGRSSIKLLWINASAVWCSVCRAEMEDIKNQGVRAAFEAKGVQLIGVYLMIALLLYFIPS